MRKPDGGIQCRFLDTTVGDHRAQKITREAARRPTTPHLVAGESEGPVYNLRGGDKVCHKSA